MQEVDLLACAETNSLGDYVLHILLAHIIGKQFFSYVPFKLTH